MRTEELFEAIRISALLTLGESDSPVVNNIQHQGDQPRLLSIEDSSDGFDFVGDVHGCYDQLVDLIDKLGYFKKNGIWSSNSNRKLVFVGDFIDRGPQVAKTIKIVHDLCISKIAYSVLGNHDKRLRNFFNNRNVAQPYSFKLSVIDIQAVLSTEEIEQISKWLNSLPPYLLLNEEVIISHAGLVSQNVLKITNLNKLEGMCLYGIPTGEVDHNGFKVIKKPREHWVGPMFQVHGHLKEAFTPIISDHVANVDTAPDFSGYLSAFRYPEHTVVQSIKNEKWDWNIVEVKERLFDDYDRSKSANN